MVAVLGPLLWFQTVDEMVAPPFPVAVPVSIVESAGKVMVWVEPAFTVGGIFAGFTIIVTDAELESPLLSVAIRVNE